MLLCVFFFFFFKQKTAYEMRISDWSSDVCSSDLATVDFFKLIGLEETRRFDNEVGRFTLIFLAAPGQGDVAEVELTYNWPPVDGSAPEEYSGGRNFGHLAYRVDDIYATCQRLMDAGVTINRPPRDGHMAFVRSPDGISVELLQIGRAHV